MRSILTVVRRDSGSNSLATIEELSDDEALRLLKRLTLHASCKLKPLYWRGVRGGPPPRGVEPQDIAQDAMVRVFDGSRAWDSTKHPDLLKFLKGVVDSMISELVTSVDNRKTRRLVRPGESGGASEAYELPGRDKGVPDLVIDRESRDKLRSLLANALRTDPVALQVLECLEADITKPSLIAEYLEYDVHLINNAQKRLRRKTEEAMKFITKGGS